MQLTCRLASFADLAVLECTGEVDLATLPRFRDALVRHVDLHPGQVVAVDVDGLAALDDAGLGILLGAGARARSRHGDVLVICGSPRLRFRLGASVSIRRSTSTRPQWQRQRQPLRRRSTRRPG
ncbi:MAG: STAS domain-containing protein [Ilumatobacteraceae bacterium]